MKVKTKEQKSNPRIFQRMLPPPFACIISSCVFLPVTVNILMSYSSESIRTDVASCVVGSLTVWRLNPIDLAILSLATSRDGLQTDKLAAFGLGEP